MTGLINAAASTLAYIGAVIILYGGAVAAIKTMMWEVRKSQEVIYHDIRRDFTHKIVFGLDFLIAGDILRTTVAPPREEILILGAIVGIRTVLGYFLNKEVKEFDESSGVSKQS